MTTLKVDDDKEKEYDSLAELVRDHPEISEAVLIYRWKGRTSDAMKNGLVFRYEYDEIDWEYSCLGDRNDLVQFADSYDVWDSAYDLRIIGQVLIGDEVGYDPDDWTNDGTPDPRIRRGSCVSADHVRMDWITLPSGHTVFLRRRAWR